MPNTGFLKDSGIKTSGKGWIKTDDMMETSIEGVFAAWDARAKSLRQAAAAAMAAYDYM